ncbi:MAG: alginate export family protein [Cyclobacteriaceae bacterium]|nr:alginate export family protein [Cyclobacteriaceae bacterium]
MASVRKSNSHRSHFYFCELLYILILQFLVLLCDGRHNTLWAQQQDSIKHELIIDLEIRPRAEFRNNYKVVPADSVMPELYISQRNRLSLTYTTMALNVHASFQEIHVWNKAGEESAIGSINFYELYAEHSLAKNLSVRIGRQALSFDNGRIFSAAPWAQQSRSHEGVRLLYTKNKVITDLVWTFTRAYSTAFDQTYSPIASNQYKWLVVHHLKYTINPSLSFTTLNSIDVFEQLNDPDAYYFRLTNGGRVEYTRSDFYFTLSGYYQSGNNVALKNIHAYYIQPEIKTTLNKTTLRLGAEILSGDGEANQNVTHSFVPLYGVAWKFMGNMNLFARFPADVNNRGLVNPYLFISFQFDKKYSVRADGNLFYSQHSLTDARNKKAHKYLGFESDLSLNFKPLKSLELNFGFSFLLPEKSMEILNKVSDSDTIPVWSYLMISFNPILLQYKNVR